MLATMTSKGQITIPKQARDAINLSPGDRIEFVYGDDGRLFLLPATRSVRSLKGMLPKPANPVTLEDMDNAIGQAVRP
ncbi:MAG: AbrB/MazE/SpoVT family DNA-binding domain-containing protein [Rhodocyclaceae bacterium]|nr:AbrB/MazE/SpoVT family DNA-binding domain-containing protein [Rhodocyclaceae bacterium]